MNMDITEVIGGVKYNMLCPDQKESMEYQMGLKTIGRALDLKRV